MTPRDWEWNHLKNRIVLLDCPLPSRWDDLYAYRHAHRMWVREGKWKQDSMGNLQIDIYDFTIFRIYTRLIKHNWRIDVSS